jgi:formylglycine-generating enzyme required for sulfatase activity
METFAVTNARYLQFLDALVARGEEALAQEYEPRERGARPESPARRSTAGTGGPLHSGPRRRRRHWQPEWPVVLAHWDAAQAFAARYSEQTGLPWRLPSELSGRRPPAAPTSASTPGATTWT